MADHRQADPGRGGGVSANRLGHLTVAQLEAAEDYLGVTLDDVGNASKLRLSVVGAWATLLRDDPNATLGDVRGLTFERLQELNNVNGHDLGEA